jgi:hypothetical protein
VSRLFAGVPPSFPGAYHHNHPCFSPLPLPQIFRRLRHLSLASLAYLCLFLGDDHDSSEAGEAPPKTLANRFSPTPAIRPTPAPPEHNEESSPLETVLATQVYRTYTAATSLLSPSRKQSVAASSPGVNSFPVKFTTAHSIQQLLESERARNAVGAVDPEAAATAFAAEH